MKLYFGFSIALILCLSSTLAIPHDDDEDAGDAIDKLDCTKALHVPDNLIEHCPKLSKENVLGVHLTKAVVDASLEVLEQCEKNVDMLCEKLPELFLNYTAGKPERCKPDLKLHVCDRINNELQGTYCAHRNTVSEIFDRSQRWHPGKETDICKLFQANRLICTVVTERLCKRIRNVITKSYCHRIIGKITCQL